MAAFIYIIFTRKQIWEGTKTDWIFLSVPLAFGIAALLHPGRAAVMEVVGLVYLYGVYLLSRYSVNHIQTTVVKDAVDFLSLLLIGISLFSFFLPVLGVVEYGYLAERKWLPFIGWVTRISGFTVTPNMLASTLFFAGFIQLGIWKSGCKDKYRTFIISGLMVAALLTFSKSLVLAVGVGSLMFAGRSWLKVAGGIIVGIYLVLCHWLIIPAGQSDAPVTYFSAEDCSSVGCAEICATTYLRLKRMALQAFLDTRGVGVGGGQFANYVEVQKEVRKYPSDMLSYDPHSTYFGILAEAGVMGVLALIVCMIVLFRHFQQNDKLVHGWYAGATAYLCLIGMEAWVMDVLNFRMLWVALGMVLAYRSELKVNS